MCSLSDFYQMCLGEDKGWLIKESGGRVQQQGLQTSKTYLHGVGELLFVVVLIDFLKQIFTQLRSREQSFLDRIK